MEYIIIKDYFTEAEKESILKAEYNIKKFTKTKQEEDYVDPEYYTVRREKVNYD